VVCLTVIGLWIYSAQPGGLEYLSLRPENGYYNLLVQGFRAGQLNLKTEAPPELARLPDPYDPGANTPYCWVEGHPLLDLSYYHGKIFLYFGVTPAVVLFWPYAALTGHYLPQKDAVLVFCALGFLASVGLLYALWRRCFAEVSFGVVLAGAAALGLGTGLPMLLSRCDVYEVAISCGYAFVMLSLAFVWAALASPRQQGWWLAAASVAYGLALGARPDLLFGAGILLIPVVQSWRSRRRVWVPGLAAIGPIVLIGSGLMLYNALRFGNPMEFGQHFQLGARHDSIQHFSLRYFWFNFRGYFLEPVRWSGAYPFVQAGIPSHFPAGHGEFEFAFGVLTGVPLVWLGLAAPLAWRHRAAGALSLLRGWLGAAGWLAATSVLTLCLYYWVADRFEVEFLPALVLLAVTGIFSLERALSGRPRWRRLARWGWAALLALSLGFNLLHAIERRATVHFTLGVDHAHNNQDDEAVRQYREALRLDPDYAEAHFNLGCILDTQGRFDEAISQYQETVRLNPDDIIARFNLGVVFAKTGQIDEAIRQFQDFTRLEPDYAQVHHDVGAPLAQMDESIRKFQELIRPKPDSTGPANKAVGR
jgi:tetratricopeptide (TPR) repeat protein